MLEWQGKHFEFNRLPWKAWGHCLTDVPFPLWYDYKEEAS
jgi:hypothetical protein